MFFSLFFHERLGEAAGNGENVRIPPLSKKDKSEEQAHSDEC